MTDPDNPAAESRSRFDHLRIKHLRLVELIQYTGSLSAAAQRLALSQPAVTAMVHDLESAFGTRLFERTTRGARLTGAGLLALDRLRHSLAAIEAARVAVAGAAVTPLLRLGVLPVVASSLLPGVLRVLEEGGELPRLVLRQDSASALIAALHSGKLDGVVGVLDSTSVESGVLADLKCEPVTRDGLCLACAPGHALAGGRNPPLADLLMESWILPPRRAHSFRALASLFVAAGLPPPQAHLESGAVFANLAMAGATSLLTVAPASAVRRAQTDGLVSAIVIDALARSNPLFFITHREGPELESLRRLKAVFQEVGAAQGA